MKIARQRVSATKSGNGLQKTLQTISIWRWLLFILFFYFFVVLVVIREKSPEIRGFSRQPARQRDNNRGCNGLSFSSVKFPIADGKNRTPAQIKFAGKVTRSEEHTSELQSH